MFLRWNTLNMTLRSSLMVENQRCTGCPLLVVSESLKDITTYNEREARLILEHKFWLETGQPLRIMRR